MMVRFGRGAAQPTRRPLTWPDRHVVTRAKLRSPKSGRGAQVEAHPTISQDWTNRERNEQKRLVALQEKNSPESTRARGLSDNDYSLSADSLFGDESLTEHEAVDKGSIQISGKAKKERDQRPREYEKGRQTIQEVLYKSRFHPPISDQATPEQLVGYRKRSSETPEHLVSSRGSSSREDIQETASHKPLQDSRSLNKRRSGSFKVAHNSLDGTPEGLDMMHTRLESSMDGSSKRSQKRKRNASISAGSESELTAAPEKNFEESSNQQKDAYVRQESTELKALRRELQVLKRKRRHPEGQIREPQQRYQIIYRIRTASQKIQIMYLDHPRWLVGDQGLSSLQGQLPIARLDAYLERHPDVAFVVFRDAEGQAERAQADNGDFMTQWSESISINSVRLIKSLRQMLDTLSPLVNIGEGFCFSRNEVTLEAPYLAFYHYRDLLLECASSGEREPCNDWGLLLQYIDDNYAKQYEYVRGLLDAGIIHRGLIHYMIKEGDVLISRGANPRPAYVAVSKPCRNTTPLSNQPGSSSEDLERAEVKKLKTLLSKQHSKSGLSTGNLNLRDAKRQSSKAELWGLDVEFWKFNMKFQKARQKVQLEVPNGPSDMIPIRDLNLVPIQYTDAEEVAKIKAAGCQFWKSRIRRYVSYRPSQGIGDTGPAELRYMIDPATYRKLHPDNTSDLTSADDLDPDLMSAEEAPPGPFLLLLPTTTHGFNMQNKRWEELQVSQISDVAWNKDAFESLVIEPFSKTLVKALVMQQLEREKGTDLITGKGQGLIVLLHGGPGTGKTFTAETVAEIAEKPLYRVTCGDLGTEPAKIEEYLESVLYLGKIWNCVVLLDEADVYLEERSMESLARNALVSVFLRVLEYYEGILILTSNRVGTFDESFKSRIQLALHYDRLKFQDRHTIWKNFLHRLENFQESGIDFDDIHRHLNDLARHELNGRQIRNAVTTSRQLARQQGKDLEFADLQQVINLTLKFDKHTRDLQGGMNDDERKREDGIRP